MTKETDCLMPQKMWNPKFKITQSVSVLIEQQFIWAQQQIKNQIDIHSVNKTKSFNMSKKPRLYNYQSTKRKNEESFKEIAAS
jgi:hypothetical protein